MSERSAVVLLQFQLLGPRNQVALTWKAERMWETGNHRDPNLVGLITFFYYPLVN